MTRRTLSDRLFRLSWQVRSAPSTILAWLAAAPERAGLAIGDAIQALATAVRGCGCTDDDPECCRRGSATCGWCLCDCHDANTTAQAAEHTEN
jgi:hypothetical protein